MAVSDSASCPAHTWSDPAASFTSFFAMYMIIFPEIQ